MTVDSDGGDYWTKWFSIEVLLTLHQFSVGKMGILKCFLLPSMLFNYFWQLFLFRFYGKWCGGTFCTFSVFWSHLFSQLLRSASSSTFLFPLSLGVSHFLIKMPLVYVHNQHAGAVWLFLRRPLLVLLFPLFVLSLQKYSLVGRTDGLKVWGPSFRIWRCWWLSITIYVLYWAAFRQILRRTLFVYCCSLVRPTILPVSWSSWTGNVFVTSVCLLEVCSKRLTVVIFCVLWGMELVTSFVIGQPVTNVLWKVSFSLFMYGARLWGSSLLWYVAPRLLWEVQFLCQLLLWFIITSLGTKHMWHRKIIWMRKKTPLSVQENSS